MSKPVSKTSAISQDVVTTPTVAVPAIPEQQGVVASGASSHAMTPANAPHLATVGLPQVPVVHSKTYSAPLSFVGSARRISALIARLANGNVGVAVALWATLGLIAVAAAWLFVAAWYVVIFGLFGVFTFPFRLIRRSQRKSQHLQQVTLATHQAMLLQQQQMLNHGGNH